MEIINLIFVALACIALVMVPILIWVNHTLPKDEDDV